MANSSPFDNRIISAPIPLAQEPSRRTPRVSIRVTRADALFVCALSFSLSAAALLEMINLPLAQSGGPDEGVYLMVARLLNHGYAYSSLFFDQLPLFPQILGIALQIGGDSIITGRMTVVLFSLLGLVGVALLTRSLSGVVAALLAVLFTVANPFYLAQSRYTIAVLPSLALTLAALAAVLLFVQQSRRVWLVLGAIFFSASLLIQPLTIGFGATIGIWLVAHRLTRGKGWLAPTGNLILDLLIFGAVGILTALPFVNLANLEQTFQSTIGFHVEETVYYSRELNERWNGMLSFLAVNRPWSGLALFGALVAARRMPRWVLPLLLGEVLSAAILLQLPPFLHHYTILAPVVAICAAIGTVAGFTFLRSAVKMMPFLTRRGAVNSNRMDLIRKSAAPLASLAFLLAFAIWLHDLPQLLRYDDNIFLRDPRDLAPLAQYVQQHTRPADFIITDDPIIVFAAGRMIPPSAINLAYPSTFKIFYQSEEKLNKTVRDYPVRAILVAGPYRGIAPMMQWIETNYPLVQKIAPTLRSDAAWFYSRE